MASSLYLFDLKRHPMPLPLSFDGLEAIRLALQDKVDGKNLRFVEFALRFEDQFPAHGPAGPLSPLGRANALRRAAWHFDLPPTDTMVAYRAAVEIAASLGLVAYDAALGIGFLPDGRVIPEALAQAASASPSTADTSPDDTLRGESEVRAVLAPALAEAMAPWGFTLEPEQAGRPGANIVLQRALGPVHQTVCVNLMRYERFTLWFQVQHDACTAVHRAAHGEDGDAPHVLNLSAEFFAPGPHSHHHWELERRSQLPAVRALVRDKLLPLAELCQDLAGLDQMLNDESADVVRTPYKTGYGWLGRPAGSDGSRSLLDASRENMQRLAVAHLNGNPSAALIGRWFDEHHARPEQARAREGYVKWREALASTAPLATWPDVLAHRAAMRPIPAALTQRAIDPRERRCHHWEVSTALHQAAMKDPADFWARFARAEGPAELQRVWRETAETLPPPDRVAPDGLMCRVTRVARAAPAEDIQVLLLVLPPIRGLEEDAILALARVGEMVRRYKMGHDHALEAGEIRPALAYQASNYVTTKWLTHLFSVDEFLAFVGETFE